jgi:hypothetical protein
MKPDGEHSERVKRVKDFGALYFLFTILVIVASYGIFVYLTVIDFMGRRSYPCLNKYRSEPQILHFAWGLSCTLPNVRLVLHIGILQRSRLCSVKLCTSCGCCAYFWQGNYMNNPNAGAPGQRYCNSCQLYKPERAHHCSICKKCVLNMDHHCPWVSNCIGFYNKKLFILVLVYACLTLFVGICGSGYTFYCKVHTLFVKNPFERK